MRILSGLNRQILYVYIVCVGIFHMYTACTGSFEAYLQRTIHLMLILPLAYLLYPVNRRAPFKTIPWYDWGLALLSMLPGLYGIFFYDDIISRIQQVDIPTLAQVLMGSLLVLMLLEGTRRVVGLPLAIIAVLFAAYMYLGNHMTGLLKGLSLPYHEIIEQLFLTDEGIFAMPLGVSATFVIVFLIFGGFLEKSGAGAYFMDVARALMGTKPGGPAQIAVLSSCLFGSISGSAVANVYGTGTFTIPLMKRIGYPAHFAGAVEGYRTPIKVTVRAFIKVTDILRSTGVPNDLAKDICYGTKIRFCDEMLKWITKYFGMVSGVFYQPENCL